jgi:hypothetical protein
MRKVRILASCAAAVAGAFGVGAYVSAHGGDTARIHACLTAKGGSIRIVAATETCKTSETALDWNITGPQGPIGTTGPQGPPGGPQGPAGPQGEAGIGALRVIGADGAPVGVFPDPYNVGVRHPTYGWLLLNVVPSGVVKQFDVLKLYAESGCTGQEYTDSFGPGNLMNYAAVAGDKVYPWSTNATGQTIHIMSRGYPNFDGTNWTISCEDTALYNWNWQVVPLVSFPLADLNLPPAPYHVE